MHYIFLLVLLCNLTSAKSLENLLKEYENRSEDSLQTLNEKMGHVRIYSQKELKLMQYDTLSDILQELPITTLTRDRYGSNTLSLVGTKANANGFFRLFINDHEVSSSYTQSPFKTWSNLPISIIDHIEIYIGEGSFTLGNETGISFIRIYTKKGSKENGGNFKTIVSNKSTNSQELSYATVLENGWSYFTYFANQNIFFDEIYNNKNIDVNSSQQYTFLDMSKDDSSFNLAYTSLKKGNYQGISADLTPNDTKTISDHFFLNYTTRFLQDKSLKLKFAIDIQNEEYEEENDQGLLLPIYSKNLINEYKEDIKTTAASLSLSKEFKIYKNNLFTAINIKNMKYETKKRTIKTNDGTTNIGNFTNFDKETSYSFALQDDYKILTNLYLIGNFKIDKYVRSSNIPNSTESLYRIGSIYLPTKNLGFKTFYTISHIPPSFYNIDYSTNIDLQSQKYKYFTFDTAYTFGKNKINLQYFNVNIDDYIYFVDQVGFMNIEKMIKIQGYIFDYFYDIDEQHKIQLNYFSSQLSEIQNNYTHGGYFKYMGNFNRFNYFGSLIYRKGFKYLETKIDDSFNLNLGASYKIDKNLTFSIKATNLLNKPTQSIFYSPQISAIDNYDRQLSFSLNWKF